MTFKNCTIYLIGFPGVGKLAIAREICKAADFRLVDSHMINKLVFPFVRVDGRGVMPPEIWIATRKIREIVLDTMVEIGNRDFNFVFTNVLLEGEEKDRNVYDLIQSAIDRREGRLIPIRILCDEVEHRRRIVSPARESDLKLRDESRVAQFHRDTEPFHPPHPDAFSIDVTNLTAVQAAHVILNQVEAIYNRQTSAMP